jgi:hypothetical protein
VIDVQRQLGIRFGIVEWTGKQHLVDGLRGRLDASGASEILPQRLANEVAQRHAPRLGGLSGPPVKIWGEQELSPMHV